MDGHICRLIVCLIIYVYERILAIWPKYILFTLTPLGNNVTECVQNVPSVHSVSAYQPQYTHLTEELCQESIGNAVR